MSGPRVLHVAAVEYTLRRLLLPQLQALAHHGYDVIVACAPEGPEFHEALEPFHPRSLSFPRKINLPGLMVEAMKLRRLVKEVKPALVHFHSPAAAIPGRAALALPMKARPLVVQTVHGFLIQREQHSSLARVVRWGERRLSRFTDLSFFVSLEDLEEAQRGRHRGLLRHLGNGVSDDWFTGDLRNRRRPGRLRAVFVGRVVREKGILDLLEALKIADQVELVVIGDQLPSERDGVMDEAVALAGGLGDRVHFTGMIEAPAIRKHFAEADLFVLPSLREGLPLSIIEAMASGLPVLATSIRGCRELVTPGINGWLVPPGNPGELANALKQAEHASDDELTALGLSSFERAGNYRGMEITARILKAYAELGVVV